MAGEGEATKPLARPLAATKTNIEHRTPNIEHRMGGTVFRRCNLEVRDLWSVASQNLVQKTRRWLVVIRRAGRECGAQRPGRPGVARYCLCPCGPHFVLLSRNFLFSRQETPKWRDATCGAASQCGRSFIRCSMLGVRCSMFALFDCGQRPLHVPRAFAASIAQSLKWATH